MGKLSKLSRNLKLWKNNGKAKVKRGDRVRISSYEKIRETLDESKRNEGLVFMESMAKFCGGDYEVLREVKWLYDESSKKILKCKDIVVLKELVCDGEGILDGKDCDRSCPYFWKKTWLEKEKDKISLSNSESKRIGVMAQKTDNKRLDQDNISLGEKRDIGYICQYTTMTDIGRELDRIEIFYQFLLRVYPTVKRRMRRWFYKFSPKSDRRSNMETVINKYQPEDNLRERLQIGDMVKVLSYPQIASTLNDKGYFKGLTFQEPMEKYCNNTYEVLKLPQYVLDQGGGKINRCKDVVILRGLYCNGKSMMAHEGCDRCCLHYWKTDWLKKVV